MSWGQFGSAKISDQDRKVGSVGFEVSLARANWPNRPPAQASGCADTNLDGSANADVDLDDFEIFRACFNGPNRPPVCE